MSTKFSKLDKEKCGNLLTISRIVHSEHKGNHSDTKSRIFAWRLAGGEKMQLQAFWTTYKFNI